MEEEEVFEGTTHGGDNGDGDGMSRVMEERGVNGGWARESVRRTPPPVRDAMKSPRDKPNGSEN
ncbi:hypothetical protein E2C01_042209 [Portunus trituberculatus]|uniref:Uncharacterized protein n=1 Tax=Portunus trituberculatus TaxID=210409 RepID=A0A5B7FSG1_PORTR|nr:hypothetical protein [Portunus trituberculatus]